MFAWWIIFPFRQRTIWWIPSSNGLARWVLKEDIASTTCKNARVERACMTSAPFLDCSTARESLQMNWIDLSHMWKKNPTTLWCLFSKWIQILQEKSSYLDRLWNKKVLDNRKNYLGKSQHLSHWTSSLFHLRWGPLFHPLYSEEVTLEGFLWAQLQPETYLKTRWRVTAFRSWESFVQKPPEHKESVERASVGFVLKTLFAREGTV